MNSIKNINNDKFLNRTNKQSISISNFNHINSTSTMNENINNSNTDWTTHIYKRHHSSSSSITSEPISPNASIKKKKNTKKLLLPPTALNRSPDSGSQSSITRCSFLRCSLASTAIARIASHVASPLMHPRLVDIHYNDRGTFFQRRRTQQRRATITSAIARPQKIALWFQSHV